MLVLTCKLVRLEEKYLSFPEHNMKYAMRNQICRYVDVTRFVPPQMTTTPEPNPKQGIDRESRIVNAVRKLVSFPIFPRMCTYTNDADKICLFPNMSRSIRGNFMTERVLENYEDLDLSSCHA